MPMTWTDTYDIVIALEERHPDIDVAHIRFTDLWQMVQNLPGFEDEPGRANEKILEKIQMTWLDERI